MTGGWFGRKPLPPSDNPERPPKGLASISKASPCCANCKCHEQENTDDR